jgi:hypothetical protein
MKMKLIGYFLIMPALASSLIADYSCSYKDNNKTGKKPESPVMDKQFKPKPGSTYSDTLVIDYSAAVFYHPDSIQLLKLKAQTDFGVFEASMHEFFFQMRNARMVIKKTWHGLRITEAKNYRYLLFIAADNKKHCIDLDTKNDAYGLLVFNRKKPPLIIDMMNIETAVSFYLKD